MSESDQPTSSTPAVATHTQPPNIEMILDAMNNIGTQDGVSEKAILNYILTHYPVGENIRKIEYDLHQELVRAVNNVDLLRVACCGSPLFRIPEKPAFNVGSKSGKKMGMKKKAAGAEKVTDKEAESGVVKP